MSFKKFKISNIKNILVITLSNIGDIILTCPIIDILRAECPQAKLSLVVGPKGESLFKDNQAIEQLLIFDKHQPFSRTIQFVLQLRKQKYDLVIDLRNTAIPALIGARHYTPLFTTRNPNVHMKEKHLARLRTVFPYKNSLAARVAIVPSLEDRDIINDLLNQYKLIGKNFVVIAPGSADHRKRWPENRFVQTCDQLIQRFGAGIVFVGDLDDQKSVLQVSRAMKHESINLCGRTTLSQLACLLSHCALAIVNDSAPMHLASYLNVPVIALFGPSDSNRYGPWGGQSCLIRKNSTCPACTNSGYTGEHECMSAIQPEDVLNVIKFENNQCVLHLSNN